MAPLITDATRTVAARLTGSALARVQEPATRRVRVEDYLTVLASMTGEAALLASGILDPETSDIPPGSPVFGEDINQVLTGPSTDFGSMPDDSVVGLLVAELVPATAGRAAFDWLDGLYRLVAAGVGSTPWGAVALDVPDGNRPAVLPLQVAYELRPEVDAAAAQLGTPPGERHIVCTVALADAIRQTAGAIDVTLGVRLALEVVFGTAKMMPMSRRAFAEASRNS